MSTVLPIQAHDHGFFSPPVPLSPNLIKQINIMFCLYLNPPFIPPLCMSNHWDGAQINLSITLADNKSRVTPNSLQGFYLSCLDRCLGILMQKERMMI